MPNGGELTIETANVSIDETEAVRGGPVPKGQYVLTSVRDTGCGMDAATIERIFEPFFTTKQADKGTGLGLSTSYGIIRRFDGHIGIESVPGAGTEFRVLMPRL